MGEEKVGPEEQDTSIVKIEELSLEAKQLA